MRCWFIALHLNSLSLFLFLYFSFSMFTTQTHLTHSDTPFVLPICFISFFLLSFFFCLLLWSPFLAAPCIEHKRFMLSRNTSLSPPSLLLQTKALALHFSISFLNVIANRRITKDMKNRWNSKQVLCTLCNSLQPMNWRNELMNDMAGIAEWIRVSIGYEMDKHDISSRCETTREKEEVDK